jgi:hypothetical protein
MYPPVQLYYANKNNKKVVFHGSARLIFHVCDHRAWEFADNKYSETNKMFCSLFFWN